MIDWDQVDELRQEIGDDDFAEVIHLFLDEVEEVMTRLNSASIPQDIEEGLHFLKGSALNLGFNRLGKICQVGERAAASGQMDNIDLAQLRQVYEASKREFLSNPRLSAA